MRRRIATIAVVTASSFAMLVACSEEPTKTDTDAGSSSSSGADGGNDDSTATDTGTSSGGASSSSSGSGGSSSSGGADVVVKKADCEDTLACHLACKSGDSQCTKACDEKASADAKTDYDAINTCAVDLCKDVTEGNAAEIACKFNNCGDKIEKCVDEGQGEANCQQTFQCLAGCTLGDFGCAVQCAQNAAEKDVAAARKAKKCIDDNCLSAPDDKQSQCILDKCAADILACTGKEAACKGLNQCTALCPESLQIAKNYCVPACNGIASAKARKQNDEYAACRVDKCTGDKNPSACWADKCEGEQTACYGVGGEQNCQEVVKCIAKDCKNFGDPDKTCVEKCLATGKAWAQDAFIHLEGCFLKNLKSKEAKTAGCSYPYDQDTCINVIVGTFCGKQSSNCFTSQ